MATRLVSGAKKRLVTYLPDFKVAINHVRAFSGLQIKYLNATPTIDQEGQQVVWPDMALGPFAQSSQFPLPGFSGLHYGDLGINQQQADRQKNLPLRYFPRESWFGERMLPSTVEMQRTSDFMMQKYVKDHLEKTFEDEFDDFYDMHYPDDPDYSSEILPKFECEVHESPRKDFLDLFPGKDLNEGPFTAMTITLKTENDMSGWSEEVEREREELLEQFIDLAQLMCDALKAKGFWADFIDPSSGRPYLGDYTNATLFETDERYKHFGFDINDIGCCKVLSHKLWGSHIFVGVLFTNAPKDDPIHKSMLLELKTLEEKEPKMEMDSPPKKDVE